MNRTRRLFFLIVFVSIVVSLWLVMSEPPSPPSRQAGDGSAAPLPPPGTLLVEVASSSTKQRWMEQAAKEFAATDEARIDGKRVEVRVKSVSSGGSAEAILEGKLKPAAWSPGSDSWVAQVADGWRARHGKPLFEGQCQPTIYTPLGIAMWRPMAEALGWPDKPIGWKTLVELAQDPKGWASYGRSDWGEFRLGHAHPKYGNSGLLTVTSFVYGMLGKTSGLNPREVYDPKVEKGLRTLAQNTAKYGVVTEDLVALMVKHGPAYLHAIATYESEALRINLENKEQLRFPVVFIFPSEGAFWGDHPYCVLDRAEWVSPEQAEGARRFLAFLRARPQQEKAIDQLLRPLDGSLALRAPLDLAHGTDPRVTPASVPPLATPSAEASDAVIDLFLITKRKATIQLVLDISGSMQGEKIRSATGATVEFLRRLQPEDKVGVSVFNQNVTTLSAPALVRDMVESMAGRIETLVAEGNTALHGAVCEAAQKMGELRKKELEAGDHRMYGIVLLSDGADTVGSPSANQMFATCLPAHAEADGVKIFPIAFGQEANRELLERIANATGGQMFSAEPDSIAKTYLRISAEQ